uniref:NADH-ubiquinone oxidoreductase chain 4L n=1 Tax=Xenopsylla cheopis TaxID=163159 RepID=A0A8F6AHR2_XENCH|nr:NADH dehydrogenase subunit 4L [Xenopsylla cheopis]
MKFLLMLILMMMMIGFLKFCMNWMNLLLSLLILEYKILLLFLLLYLCMMMYEYENYFCNIYIVYTVCEGVLGLCILVSMIRTHGNDYFMSFNMLQC